MKEFDNDPVYSYKKGRFEGLNIEKELLAKVDTAAKTEALSLVNEYHAGTTDSDRLAAKLHAALVKIGATTDMALPSFDTKEERERYIANAAGYLYGTLEALACAAYIQQDRQFVDSRHKEVFGRMLVEAQLVLGKDTGALANLIEGLKAGEKAPSVRLEEALATIREIDARIEKGATITEVYPLVLATINELQVLVDKEGGNNVPVAIAELLRIIDLYADRNETTFVDKLRQKALDALPAAIKSIQGAA